MIVKLQNVQYYLDNKIAKEIEIYVQDIKNSNEDLVILIDGPEGSGKSKLARQIAAYIHQFFEETKFGVDNIHFDINEYINSSLKGDQYQINILDESRKVLNRRRATSKDTVRFTNYLSECRSKNQIHLILLPSYCDLDKYIIMWRAKILLHCKKYRNPETNALIKGEGRVIPINNELFYMWDRGYYEYPKFNPKKKGGYQYKWNDIEVLTNINVYEAKKEKNMELKYGHESDKPNISDRDKIISHMSQKGYSQKEIGSILDLDQSSISKIIKKTMKYEKDKTTI